MFSVEDEMGLSINTIVIVVIIVSKTEKLLKTTHWFQFVFVAKVQKSKFCPLIQRAETSYHIYTSHIGLNCRTGY